MERCLTMTYDETETLKTVWYVLSCSLPTGVYTRWHSGNVPTTIAGNVNYGWMETHLLKRLVFHYPEFTLR
jgi:hypothetical protein